jgi:hypothetical protein
MSAQLSADVRALFAEFGIETEKVVAIKSGLVIDRFDQPAGSVPIRDTIGFTGSDAPFEVEIAA